MTAFALITPDAVVDGRVDEIVDIFRSNGLTITSLEYVPVSAERMLRVYGGTSYALPGRSGDLERISSSLVDRVFSQAPGIVVDFEPEPDIYETVLRIKGATDPFAAEPGSIRRSGRDALFNSLHCPDDAMGAKSERPALTSTKPSSMSDDAMTEFVELDRLALTSGSFDLESTVVRVLLRRRANALRYDSKPLLAAVDPSALSEFVAQLGSAEESIARRQMFGEWAAENAATDDILAILEKLAPETTHDQLGALCRQDQDLVELGLAVERSRSSSE